MAEEDEWKKLPTDQKVQQSSWKARAEGYNECIKKFPMYDEKGPEFLKYLGLMKKFVTDSNELNRVQGLQAALVYVQNAHCAGKTCSEVISGVISKCFNSKPRLRELGIDLCIMFIEIDKNELAVEEILKGFSNKQPKVVHACIETILKALSEFGSKVISIKPILKLSIKMLDHRDKNVRESTKLLFVEMYRWIGAAVQVPLQGINPVVLKELSEEWEKLGPGGQAKQQRFMRSQQDLREKFEAKSAKSGTSNAVDVQEEVEAVDPYDLLEPQDILSKLSKTFYDQIEEKKWQERKMALEECEKLVTLPKLQPGDYADLVKALKKVLSKDSNIMLVTIAIKCLTGLAAGLRKKFQPYAVVCLDGMLERFKEKKITVLTALQEAVDKVYLTSNIQAVSESCLEALANKNPSIRAQTGYFLSRAVIKTKASAINKALLKQFLEPLLKNMDHSTPDVRESAFQAVGAFMKVTGEVKVQPFLADLDKLKMDKIKECAGKFGVPAKPTPVSKPNTSAPSKAVATQSTAAKKTKAAVSKASSGDSNKSLKGGKKNATAAKPKTSEPAIEQEMSDDSVEEKILEVLSGEEKSQVLNNNWKERLAGLQSTTQKLKMLDRSALPCQAFVKFLSIKPGFKDNNFNCLNEKFGIVKFLAENGTFSRTSVSICLNVIADKVADVKCGTAAKHALSSMSEATGFPWVVEQVLSHAMSQKNPKIQSESLIWLSNSFREFGVAGVNMKFIIDKTKLALAATNPAVRTAALNVIGTLGLFLGNKMRMFFESEKPALLSQIDAELEKVQGQPPPVPTRLGKVSKGEDVQNDEEDEEAETLNFDDMITRVDISSKITDALVSQLSDKNWKERKLGLEAVVAIIEEAKFLDLNLGELPIALRALLSDSNKILVTTTVNIFSQLGTALGPHCTKHLHTILANLLTTLADNKPLVRQAALKCMGVWLTNTKLSMFLEGDTMHSALSVAKHTFLRIELLNWLAEKLLESGKITASGKEGMELCVPVLYSCCEDRSGDVRAKAQACLPAFMRHLSYDKMLRGTGKLGGTSKATICTLLDKSREQMPAPPQGQNNKKQATKPPTNVKNQSQPVEESKPPAEPAPSKTKEKRTTSKRQPAATAKKVVVAEEDTSPLFINLPNGKEQRMKDEIKLKTIKWNFVVPREELVTQLQQQLATCVGTTLMTHMFHHDFQQHLKAISILTQAVSSDWNSTVNCLDILLRWITLRFYDKNTTVHIKCFEYLKTLFEKLTENNYKASEYEMSSFLPHLIIKIGESKDNIRKAVHGVMKQISTLYPSSKLFNYIMDGIKSKNSRQRCECLDHIALLIERNGVSVCQPTPAKALKEIATSIGDRDKTVRSSALNAIVAAYNVSGEIVFKQVGKLNEKDMSMLEERVKRSGKFVEGALPPVVQQAPTSNQGKAPKDNSQQSKLPSSQPSAAQPERGNTVSSKREPPQEIYEEDPAEIPEIKKLISQLQPVNVDHLLEPIPVPDCIKEYNQANANTNAKSTLDVIISQISSPQISASITAHQELWEVTNHKDKWPLLAAKMEELLNASSTQLRLISVRYLPMVVSAEPQVTGEDATEVTEESFLSLCKSNFSVLLNIFSIPILASKPSAYVLFDLLRSFIQLLVSEHLTLLTNSKAAKLTQSLNMLVLRMLKNCDQTAISCAVVRVLHDGMESATAVFIDLVVKCLWKFGEKIPSLFSKEPNKEGAFQHQPLNVAALLVEIDRFWRAYPKDHQVYVRLHNVVPLRSVKTIIVMLCKQMGPKAADNLYMINNQETSDVVHTVQKYTGLTSSELRKRMSASSDRKENIASLSGVSLEAKLSAIFKKVGDRNETSQGLLELHEFKEENPSFDVNKHVDSLDNELYRDYVKRGLAKIESQRHFAKTGQNLSIPDWTTKNRSDRLNNLRLRCGLEPLDRDQLRAEVESELGISSSQTKSKGTNSDSKILAPSTAVNQNSSGGTATTQDRPRQTSTSASSLSDLKRRLEQIKQGATSR